MTKWIKPTVVVLAGTILVFTLGASCSESQDYQQVVRVERDEGRQILQPERQADLAVVFTGSTRGEFEPCGCGGVFEGGFARRAVVIDRLRTANPNLLLLDTGDLTGGASSSQTEFISEAYGLLKYDAIAVGEGDLRVGREPFEKFARQYRLPYVASNLHFKTPSAIQEVIALRRGGRKIAVISLISDRWLGMLPMNLRDQFTFEPPAASLKRLVPVLRKQYDTIVLLSHLGPAVREGFATSAAGVDLWIDTSGHPGMESIYASAVRRSTSQPAAAPAPAPASFFKDRTPPLFVSWQNDRKIGIAGLKWTNGRLTVPMAEMLPLSKAMIQDKRFLEIYDTYRFVSRQEMIRLLTNPLRPIGTNTSTQPAGFQYVPSERCGACHAEIYRFWQSTKHAQAFGTLQKDKREYDLNCWACHTTGFREPGGFDSPASTPTLVNVGCQDCHEKDLRTHPGTAASVKPVGRVGRSRDNLTQSWHCQRCHVPHRSPNFVAGPYLQKINCSQAVTKPAPSKQPQ